MNKIKLFAAIAIVATITTLTASCEKTQTPEEMQLAKRKAIENEIQETENKLFNFRENTVDPKTGLMRLPSKDTIEQMKTARKKLDSLRNSIK